MSNTICPIIEVFIEAIFFVEKAKSCSFRNVRKYWRMLTIWKVDSPSGSVARRLVGRGLYSSAN